MVYIIHIREKIGRCQHYIGYTGNLERRINEHKNHNGSPLLREANRRGIIWDVVVEIPNGDRNTERRLKNHKKASDFCPVCNPKVADIPFV
jgi:predicted GIY-YIG superfamily endonuclease